MAWSSRWVERKQSSIRASPKPPAAVFIQNVDPIGLRVIADGQCREPGTARRVVAVALTFGPPRDTAIDQWGEPVDPAAVGRHEVRAERGLEEVVDPGVGEALGHAVSGESLTIEAAQALWPAEPEESAGIDNDARDAKVGEAVGGRVGFDRQPLGRRGAGQSEDKSESAEDSSHRATLNSRVELYRVRPRSIGRRSFHLSRGSFYLQRVKLFRKETDSGSALSRNSMIMLSAAAANLLVLWPGGELASPQ